VRLGEPPGEGLDTVGDVSPRANRRGREGNLCNKTRTANPRSFHIPSTPQAHQKQQRQQQQEEKNSNIDLIGGGILTAEVPLLGRALDVVRRFDYGHILFLTKTKKKKGRKISRNRK